MAVFMIGAVGKQESEKKRPNAKRTSRETRGSKGACPCRFGAARCRFGAARNLATARMQCKRRTRRDGALGRRKLSARAQSNRRSRLQGALGQRIQLSVRHFCWPTPSGSLTPASASAFRSSSFSFSSSANRSSKLAV